MLDFSPLNLSKVEASLERIADALDRAYPPHLKRERRVRGTEALVDISQEAVANRDALDSFLESQNLTPAEQEKTKKEIDGMDPFHKKALLDNIRQGLG